MSGLNWWNVLRSTLPLLVLLITLWSCQKGDLLPPIEILSQREAGIVEPELKGLDTWINSEPFTLEDQRGKVVLIDFWTYTCVNCIRTLPYLKDWYAKYSDQGLVILGVHSPEFEFEKSINNVQEAVSRFGINHPVALDNNMVTWDVFDNRYWPAKYLLDQNGTVRYQHFGEGSYEETESIIRVLLTDAGYDVSDIAFSYGSRLGKAAGSTYNKNQTRELYAGTHRNYSANPFHPPYIGNREYFEHRGGPLWEKETVFFDPDKHEKGRIYISGLWSMEEESLRHARDTVDNSDYVFLRFSASEVNAVFGSSDEVYDVLVTLNGIPLKPSQKGDDIVFDERGVSFIRVDRSDMFNLVRLKDFQTGELKLSSKSSGFEIFSFTFGSKSDIGN